MNKLPEELQRDFLSLYELSDKTMALLVNEIPWLSRLRAATQYFKMARVFDTVFKPLDNDAVAYFLQILRAPMEDCVLRKSEVSRAGAIRMEVDCFLCEFAPQKIKGLGYLDKQIVKTAILDSIQKAILMALMARGAYRYAYEAGLLDKSLPKPSMAVYTALRKSQ